MLTIKLTYVWRGKTMIDKANVWWVIELTLVCFIALGGFRMIAVFMGYLADWLEHRKRFKPQSYE